MKRFFRHTRLLLGKTFSNALTHEVPLHGAAIAFYTIFSVAPILILMLSLSEFLLSESLVRQKLYSLITHFTGPQMAKSLQILIESYSRSPSNIAAYILAVIVLLFGATTVITQLKSSLNTIWGISKSTRGIISQYMTDRLVSILTIFIVTGLFISTLFLEAVFPLLTKLLDFLIPSYLNSILSSGLPTTSILLTVVFFMVIFRILPDTTIPWKDIFVGAVFTTALFLIGKYFVGLYLSNSSIQITYRAAGSFVVFLIWTYYNVQILLLGAEFTRVYSSRSQFVS